MADNGSIAPIIVEIDNELEPIVPEFLEKRSQECPLILEMLAQGRLPEITVLGHRMKGAGGSYGFDLISELGEVMENASMAGDQESIRLAVAQLSNYLARVSVVYV